MRMEMWPKMLALAYARRSPKYQYLVGIRDRRIQLCQKFVRKRGINTFCACAVEIWPKTARTTCATSGGLQFAMHAMHRNCHLF